MNRLTLNSKRQQQGAVLLVALVMLLLLTLIGVASMRGTSLQENMASNLRDSNTSFQAAEAGLRAGERRAEELYYTLTDQDVGFTEAGEHASDLGLASEPRYQITLLAKEQRDRDSHGSDIASVVVRIDAWGGGLAVDGAGQPVITTQLRSIYYLSRD